MKTGKPELNSVGKDLAIWRWSFFLRWQGRNPSEALEEHWQRFLPVLDSAIKWIGGVSKTDLPTVAPASRQTSLRLVSKELQGDEALPNALESRTLLDSFFISTAVAKSGLCTSGDISDLRPRTWSAHKSIDDFEAVKGVFLGETECIWVEVPIKLTGKTAARISTILLTNWSGREDRQLVCTKFDFGFVCASPDPDENVFVLLINDNDISREEASYFLHWILPQLWIVKLKVPILRNRFESALPKMYEWEKQIHTKINEALSTSRHIEGLEKSIDQLTYLSLNLSEVLGQCVNYLQTIKVNSENLDRVLSDSPFKGSGNQLKDLLVFPIRSLIEQFNVDLAYAEMEKNRAEELIKNFNAMSQVRQARWERLTVVIFGVFVILGVADAFPELTKEENNIYWYFRLAGVIGFGALLYFITRLSSLVDRWRWSAGRKPEDLEVSNKGDLHS